MHYATQAGGNAVNAISKAPPPLDTPRLVQQLQQLDKLLSECHHNADSVERATDRLVGCVPENAGKVPGESSQECIERKLSSVIAYTEHLCTKLANSAQRLNGAV